jgi:RNA polymerase sigma-70 factor (ECF subfamily)
MQPRDPDRAFARYQRRRRPADLAEVFDATAPELLRVAAHLAPSLAEAEDLVQETFLVAMARPARYAPGGAGVLAWLLGVLRHRALRQRRAGARRLDPERAALAPRDPEPRAAAESRELAAAVDGAIERVPATYRAVLRLHLQHGLSAGEIALALERPAATVRTLLARGLARLRERLPAGLAGGLAWIPAERGLAAVRATVLAQAEASAPALLGAAVLAGLGGLTMKKASMCAALLVAAAAIGWRFLGPMREAEVPVNALARDAAMLTVDARAENDAASVSEPAVPLRTRVPASDVTTAALRVRVTWADDGNPAAGVGVSVHRPWDERAVWFLPRPATDAQGVALLEGLAPGHVYVQVLDVSDPHVELRAGEEASLAVSVHRRARVRGRVVDAAGQPVSGAEIWKSTGGNYTFGSVVTTSDARGEFVVHGTPSYLGARKEGYAPSYLLDPRPADGREATIELRLDRAGARISGRVVDASGAPIAGALVLAGVERGYVVVLPEGGQANWPPAQALRTDADGRFTTASMRARYETPVQVWAAGFGPAIETVDLQDGATRELEVVLEREAIVAGVVRDAAGRAVSGASVRSFFEHQEFRSAKCTAGADGSFRLPGLPSGAVKLRADADGHGKIEASLTLVAGETTAWEPRLEPEYRIAGRVVDENGAGRAGVPVYADGTDTTRTDRKTSARTDANGAFTLRCEYAGTFEVRVGPPTGFPWAQVTVPTGREDLLIRLTPDTMPSALLRGTLVDAAGAPARDVEVLILRGDRGYYGGDLDAQGGFTFGPMPPGRCVVRLTSDRFGMRVLDDLEVTTHRDLDLGRIVLEPPGSLRITADGASERDVLQVLTSRGTHVMVLGAVDGVYNSQPLAPGEYVLQRFREPCVPLAVRSGAPTEVELHPPSATRCIVHVVASEALPEDTAIEVRAFDQHGRLAGTSFEAGAGQTKDVALALPDGRFRVEVTTRDGWRGGGELVVGAGGTPSVTLELTRD